jgi:hypothetical protein
VIQFCPSRQVLINRFGDFGQEPLAHARGSESGSIVCNNLPSRDRKGAVAGSGFPQIS